MKIVIIKYNAGNIRSVLFAMERIGVDAEVTDDPEIIKSADKVIFPGVGEASSAMSYLRERKLDVLIKDLHQPVLGVCLGLQLLCSYSEENNTECMGVFSETVKKFKPLPSEKFKVPQMGWNNIYELGSPLFKNIPENSFCYFVHGYYAGLGNTTIAKTNYVQPYSSALHRENFYGVQFHPEKSADTGEQILKNFIQL
jgi:imidazole glycerol-phosphate synthase subunit HisH